MARLFQLLVAASAAAAASAVAPLHKGDGTAPANDWVVVFYKESTADARAKHMDLVKAATAEGDFGVTREYSFNKFFGYAATLSAEHLDLVRADDKVVEFVEADQVMKASVPLSEQILQHVDLKPKQAEPEAQRCSVQAEATWGLVRTAERELKVDGLFYHDDDAGAGVDAYIVDTGIYLDHVEFEGRAIWGADTANNPSPETDLNGHGTHVAGTVMSKTYGVAKEARAIAVAVLGASGSGSTAGVIQGVEFVCKDHLERRNRCVANMSLGGGYSLAMNRAVEEAIDCGCQFAVAAGNENNNACFSSPASNPDCVTVASSTNSDTRSYFSNYGQCANIFAPGSSITSTWIGSRYAINTISGTSMASPHVCGVMAKMLTDNPSMTPAEIKTKLSEDATKDKITDVQGTVNELLYATCTTRDQ